MLHRLVLSGLLSAALSACAATASSTAPAAPAPATPVATSGHPAYLHALADLRSARSYLSRPAGVVVKWDENAAIREIDSAIGEIKSAAIDDGKPIDDHPLVESGMVWGARLHRSAELIETARAEIHAEDSTPVADGLRDRAEHHLTEATRFVNEGILDAARPNEPNGQPPVVIVVKEHPAYLHALTDLRAARGWLGKMDGADAKFDQHDAIAEIDAAIDAIKKAAIDDHKELTDHPTIDVAVNHKDRLRRALDLLDGAQSDIEQKEDNEFAQGLRKRAVDHIRKATSSLRVAVEDRKQGKN